MKKILIASGILSSALAIGGLSANVYAGSSSSEENKEENRETSSENEEGTEEKRDIASENEAESEN